MFSSWYGFLYSKLIVSIAKGVAIVSSIIPFSENVRKMEEDPIFSNSNWNSIWSDHYDNSRDSLSANNIRFKSMYA